MERNGLEKPMKAILAPVLDDNVALRRCVYSVLQCINRLRNWKFMGANIVLNYGQIHFLREHWHKLHHLQKAKTYSARIY